MSFNNGSNGNVAVIVGHPAHVLRVYRFIEIHKPIVYILTDGSGSKGGSRCGHVTRVIEDLGATTSRLTCRFTDAEMYRMVMDRDTETLGGLVDEIVDDLARNDIARVAGDALEGFNPVHDLCRYMINAAVKIYSDRQSCKVGNFDFLLDGPPDPPRDEHLNEVIRIELSTGEFARKMRSVNEYPGIQLDIESAMQAYGETAFRTETLRPVKDGDEYASWDTPVPYYESYGAKMVEQGVYSEVITFQNHLLPLARYLTAHADASVNQA